MRKPGPPIVVTGMHRSGTSLSASILAALGVAMGEQLLPADAANPRGYFEDLRLRGEGGSMICGQVGEGLQRAEIGK
jgi:hypothetical protein